MKTLTHILRGFVRGLALFFGLFSAANIFVSRAATSMAGEDIWWISMQGLPAAVITLISVLAALTLIGFALKPRMGRLRMPVTFAICLIYIYFAGRNVISYYQGLSKGLYHSVLRVALPFSLFVLVMFVAIALFVVLTRKQRARRSEGVVLALAFLLSFVMFPVAQMWAFGTTDYARKADVLVVLGAAAKPDGTPSRALRSRLDHAVQLYQTGLVSKIIMSGGIETSGVNEAEAMRDYAVAQGVPSEAILLDEDGSDTDHTVANTVPMFQELDAATVLVDSHFYHLPRIKMAYRAHRVNVLTTPCAIDLQDKIVQSSIREIPAFWYYWLRSGVRSVR